MAESSPMKSGLSCVDLASPSKSPDSKRTRECASSSPKSVMDEKSPVFKYKYFASVPEAAQVLFDAMKPSKPPLELDARICSVIPAFIPKKTRECSYLVNLEIGGNRRDLAIDGYGKWTCKRSSKEYFEDEFDQLKLVSRSGKMKQGIQNYDYVMARSDYDHADLNGDFSKRVYKLSKEDELAPIGLVSYKWICHPYDFSPSCHGNAKKYRWESWRRSDSFFFIDRKKARMGDAYPQLKKLREVYEYGARCSEPIHCSNRWEKSRCESR
ncbi:MAG: hypothetical protein GY820_11570 [Gammaproteobacteria bacterium]|nr:hypothetical protein [Gammaproteobacteria bacterium]